MPKLFRKTFPVARHSVPLLATALGLALAGPGVHAADLEVVYTTRAGDTLIGLERQYLSAPFGWKGLKALNRIGNPMRLPVGSPLRIPENWLRAQPHTARVVAVSGDVTMDGKPLAPDTRVSAGAILRTGDGGFVTLALPDESRLTVQPGSQARLEKVQSFHGLPGQNARIHLEQGRIESSVAPQRGPAARYQIRTPSATLSVRGTAFRAGTDPDAGTAQAEVTAGEVGMRNATAADATGLPAGFGVVARAGAPIPAPRALLPAPALDEVPALFRRITMDIPFPPIAKAVAYRAQIARDEAFSDVVATAVFATPRARFTDLPDGDYRLRVRAIDAEGLEGRDATRDIALRARPEPPEATSAPPGVVAWSARPDASSYRLQIADDSRFAQPAIDRKVDGLQSMPPLGPGRYAWRIASLRTDGNPGPWSDPQTLDIRPAPGPATVEHYNRRLRLAWAGRPGQIYDVQLARDEAFQDLVVDQRIGEAALTLPEPGPGRYRLRIRATDPDGGVSPWSGIQHLQSLHLLPIWSLSAPAVKNP